MCICWFISYISFGTCNTICLSLPSLFPQHSPCLPYAAICTKSEHIIRCSGKSSKKHISLISWIFHRARTSVPLNVWKALLFFQYSTKSRPSERTLGESNTKWRWHWILLSSRVMWRIMLVWERLCTRRTWYTLYYDSVPIWNLIVNYCTCFRLSNLQYR